VRLGVPSRHRRRFADAAVSQLRVHVWVVRCEIRGFQQNQGFYSFEVKQTTMLLCKRAALLPDLTIQSFFHQCCEMEQQDQRVRPRALAKDTWVWWS
jgi:hypothetical protein